MTGNFGNIFEQLGNLQSKFQEMQKNSSDYSVTGTAGVEELGKVDVTITGNLEVKNVKIHQGSVTNDINVLEDLFKSSLADALAKLKRERENKMKDVLSGMNLPEDILKNVK